MEGVVDKEGRGGTVEGRGERGGSVVTPVNEEGTWVFCR